MKKKILIVILFTLAVGFITLTLPPAPVSASKIASTECECVGYALRALFNSSQPRPGNWPTAASMATSNYWGNINVVGRGNQRTKQNYPRPGDVVIMQAEATVYPWNVETHWWDFYFENNAVGWGSGHIGFVTQATYWNDYGGWFISMRSANWHPSWGYHYEDQGCSNVSDSQVFIPNGPAVSYWH